MTDKKISAKHNQIAGLHATFTFKHTALAVAVTFALFGVNNNAHAFGNTVNPVTSTAVIGGGGGGGGGGGSDGIQCDGGVPGAGGAGGLGGATNGNVGGVPCGNGGSGGNGGGAADSFTGPAVFIGGNVMTGRSDGFGSPGWDIGGEGGSGATITTNSSSIYSLTFVDGPATGTIARVHFVESISNTQPNTTVIDGVSGPVSRSASSSITGTREFDHSATFMAVAGDGGSAGRREFNNSFYGDSGGVGGAGGNANASGAEVLTSVRSNTTVSRDADVSAKEIRNVLGSEIESSLNTNGIHLSSNATANSLTLLLNSTAISVADGGISGASSEGTPGGVGGSAWAAAATAVADANLISTVNATTQSNAISNLGTIDISDNGTLLGSGIRLDAITSTSITADSRATATSNETGDTSRATLGARSSTASAFSSATSVSLIDNNEIVNSGTINAAQGIYLFADSYAEANALVTSNQTSNGDTDTVGGRFTTAISSATSEITRSDITNTGRIVASTEGIYLEADADAVDGRNASVEYAALLGLGTSTVTAKIGGSSDNANTITNAGTIVVSNGNGIKLYALAGSSTTPPDTATGVVEGNTIVNTGLIVTTSRHDGIRLEAEAFGATSASATVSNNIITNSGFLYARDDGIQLYASAGGTAIVEGNEITNSYPGRIVSWSNAIELDSPTVQNNTITNSGLLVTDRDMTISGTSVVKGTRFALNNTPMSGGIRGVMKIQSDATSLLGDDPDLFNTVNLNAPSYVAGHFEFNRFADVRVNLTSGVSHSVRWVFKDVNDVDSKDALGASRFSVAGPVPWFTTLNTLNSASTNEVQDGTDDIFATIDPSAFAAAPNQLSDLSDMTSGFAAEGLGRRGAQRNGLWVAANGTRMSYSGDQQATMDQRTRLEGAAFGYNRDFNSVRVGVMLGEAKSKLRVGSFYSDIYNHSYENKANGAFAGVHLQGALGALQVGLGLTTGKMKHEDRRFINDNLQWWGESYATSTYSSRWYAPEFTLSLPVTLTDTVTLTPSVHARHSVQKFDRYTETGSNANATVHAHTVKMGETRVGLDLTKKYAGNSTVGVQLGYVQRDLNGQDFVRVTMIGDTKNVPMFTRNMGAGYVGFNWNLALTDAVSFQLKGTHMNGTEGNGGNVSAKLNVEF